MYSNSGLPKDRIAHRTAGEMRTQNQKMQGISGYDCSQTMSHDLLSTGPKVETAQYSDD